jgi:hypothetical protein
MKHNPKLLKTELNQSKHLMGIKEETQKEKKSEESKSPLTDEIKTEILKLIKSKNGKKIDDKEVHSIADKYKVSPHKLESFIYTEFSKRMSKSDLKEGKVNTVDTITMNVPLFIRMLEFAKEDAKTDMDLHIATEKILEQLKNKDCLNMDSYDYIVSKKK